MGNRLLDDLLAAGKLAAYWDFRKGTLLDQSGNGNTLTVFGTPTWAKVLGRRGVAISAAGSHYLSPGNPAALQLGTATIFAVGCRQTLFVGNFPGILSKANAVGLDFNIGAEPRAFGIYDFTFGFRASTFAEAPVGQTHFYATSYRNGVANGTTFYVDGVARGVTQTTIVNQGSPWLVVTGALPNQGFGGVCALVGIVNRVLTPAEHARLYDDFLAEGISADLPRRNFWIPRTGATDAENIAAGVALDTVFESQMVAGVRKIVDNGPNNYAGTITGVLIPSNDGEGVTNAALTSDVSFGDVTQWNSAPKISWEQDIEFAPGNVTSTYTLIKRVDNSNNIIVGTPTGAAASPRGYLFYVSSAVALRYGITDAACYVRGGCRQHIQGSFDGTQATDALKMQVCVDGVEATLSFPGGALPASTANLAGVNLRLGNTTDMMIATYRKLVCRNVATTIAERRKNYVAWARRLTLRETFEDVPVSLAASVAAGGYIGQWRVISGTWKCSETTDGKRWVSKTGAAGYNLLVLERPAPAFGTWVFSAYASSPGGDTYFYPILSLPAPAATAGQYGYGLQVRAGTGDTILRTIENGVITSFVINANIGVAVNVLYQFCLTRRPSDGRFTLYVRGGAFTKWVLVGAGTNANVVTSKLSMWQMYGVADGGCLYDPRDPNVGLRHYQGVLDPTAGELP